MKDVSFIFKKILISILCSRKGHFSLKLLGWLLTTRKEGVSVVAAKYCWAAEKQFEHWTNAIYYIVH